MNTSTAFKFPLQNDKYNETNNYELKNKSVSFGYIFKEVNDIKDNSSILKSKDNIDFNNITIKNIISRYNKTIESLKSYILRLNKEIRTSLINENIVFPDLNNEENDEKDGKDNNEKVSKLLNNFIDPEYSNPIFSIYDKHIAFLENENKQFQDKMKYLESQLSDALRENQEIREDNLYYKNELHRVLHFKVQSSNVKVVNSEDFIKQIEERNDILSRENELLTINYQKVTKDFYDYKLQVHDSFQNYINKTSELNSSLNNNFDNKNYIEDLKNMLTIAENKVFESAEIISKLETNNEENCIIIEKMRNEIASLKESVEFYKKQLNI